MLEGICQSPFIGHYGIFQMLAFPAIWYCWLSGIASLKNVVNWKILGFVIK
jgi:hypothetical protein